MNTKYYEIYLNTYEGVSRLEFVVKEKEIAEHFCRNHSLYYYVEKDLKNESRQNNLNLNNF